jgi:hypothetical protein
MPVQDGPSPLGYAPSRARQAGTAGVSTASPRGGTSFRNALSSHDAPPLRPTQLPDPPLAPAKTRIFASTARLSVVALAASGALGLLWVILLSLRETPRPAAQDVATERAPDPSAGAERDAATGAALYQDFLKWRQLQVR